MKRYKIDVKGNRNDNGGINTIYVNADRICVDGNSVLSLYIGNERIRMMYLGGFFVDISWTELEEENEENEMDEAYEE